MTKKKRDIVNLACNVAGLGVFLGWAVFFQPESNWGLVSLWGLAVLFVVATRNSINAFIGG